MGKRKRNAWRNRLIAAVLGVVGVCVCLGVVVAAPGVRVRPTALPLVQATDGPRMTATVEERVLPTLTRIPTQTQPPRATATRRPSGGGSGYDNNGDGRVTCADFRTQAAAQAAYNAGHKNLDGNDKDGKACESLP